MQSKANPDDYFSLRMVLLVIIVSASCVLIAIVAVRCHKTVIRTREDVLTQDLLDMRKAIQDYTQDKGCSPSSLNDLVTAGYLREIPADPFTKAKDWVTSNSDLLIDPDQKCTGISDVNSSSNGVSPFTNTAYSSW